jgi:hypothetical protein
LGGRSAGAGRVFVLIGLLEFVEVAGDGEVDGFDESWSSLALAELRAELLVALMKVPSMARTELAEET